MSSLRKRVALWLLPPLLLMLIVSTALSYRSTLDAVNLAYDRSLYASTMAIAEQCHVEGGIIRVNIPDSALEIFSEGAQERVFYAVFAADGSLLTGYHDLPVPDARLIAKHFNTTDAIYRGSIVRIGNLSKQLYSSGIGSVSIVVAETTERRNEIARELLLSSIGWRFALVGLAALLVLASLATAFRPLIQLGKLVRERNAEDMTPLLIDEVPSEVKPLIDSINQHLTRLAKMLMARKRFLADAAHQLRTPLTVLSTQVDYGLKQSDADEMRQTLLGLQKSIRSTQHLAHQMLALSRAEAVHAPLGLRQRLDLTALVKSTALELSLLALDNNIDLSYQGQDKEIAIMGDASMMRELLFNLIDNALRYSPNGGKVAIMLTELNGQAQLEIIDNGTGIAPAERENVLKRFYRSPEHSHIDGSGLGLSIVQEICAVHGASLTLLGGVDGTGLVVRICFFLYNSAN